MPERPVEGVELARSLTTLDGRYHVVDRIAAGGMGEVFRATDAVLEREVAIKVLHRALAGDRGFVDRFRREARAAASLNHPNIVAVYDWGAVDGVYFMVMEFVRGVSVRDLLNAEGLLAPAHACEVLQQTLAALGHAHRQGIVHRDVKPENVMITRDGVAKVADFGLARAYADAQITEAGNVTGTVQYLAPEQLQGEPADPRTDLYSLGIVAYELLTGQLPFGGETPMAIAYKHLHERVPRPSIRNPAVTEGLDGWVASMTEKQRELRPESAAEARRDLAEEAANLPPAGPIGELVPDVQVMPIPPDPGRATTVSIPRAEGARRRGYRRRRRRWLLGALFALLALGAAAWGSWTYLVPHRADVPRVVGMSAERAEAELDHAGLVVRLADGEYSTTVATGEIIRTAPTAGTELEKGDRVTLVPSLGPPPVPVPNVVGLTIPKARKALADAELKLGQRRHRFDEHVPAGEILDQSVAADDRAPQGSAIDVVVSKGPSPVPVPKVIGKSATDARAALSPTWTVGVTSDYSDTVPRGDVISQDPDPKTRLQPGQTVTIVVSLGPRELPVPNLKGLTKDAAVAQIRSLGLIPNVLPVPGGTGDTVVSQLPGPGTMVRAGSTITIYIA